MAVAYFCALLDMVWEYQGYRERYTWRQTKCPEHRDISSGNPMKCLYFAG